MTDTGEVKPDAQEGIADDVQTIGTAMVETATVPEVVTTTGDDPGGSAPTPERPVTPIAVISVSANPNPAYEGSKVDYSARISGNATSVILTLVADYDGTSSEIPLFWQSTDGDVETWTANGAAGVPQPYYFYLTATDAMGQEIVEYGGMLMVNAFAY